MSEGQCADGDAWEGAGVGGLGREEPGPPWGQVQETQQPPGGAARWLLVRPVGGGGEGGARTAETGQGTAFTQKT